MDEEERMKRDEVVARNLSLVRYTGPLPAPENPNPAMPDDVWARLHALGGRAVTRLEEIIDDPRFVKMHPKDKLAAIELAMKNAYQQETINKHLHIHANKNDPTVSEEGNALTKLSITAKRRLPEFQKRSLSNKDTGGVTINHDPLDGKSAEHVTRNRNK